MSAVYPPDVPQILRDHRNRIRALEALPANTLGVQFDRYPQAGNFLYAESTDGASAGRNGIELNDTSVTGDGIYLHSVNGLAKLEGDAVEVASLGTTLDLSAATDMNLLAAGDFLTVAQTGQIVIRTEANSLTLSAVGGDLLMGTDADATLGAGVGHKIDLVVENGAGATMTLADTNIQLRTEHGVFGAGSLIWQAYDQGGGHWNHEWWDPGGLIVMALTWNGSDYDYQIRNGHVWQAVL